MSSSSSTSEFINNANEALKFILDISENFPIIGQVASICKTIYEKADTASSNKDNCAINKIYIRTQINCDINPCSGYLLASRSL